MLAAKWFAFCVVISTSSLLAAPPILSEPRFVTNHFKFNLSSDSDDAYIIESSTDLKNWQPLLTNDAWGVTRSFIVPATNSRGAYRAKVATPLASGFGILAQTVSIPDGHVFSSDSFDSADPTASTDGRYDPTKRRDRSHLGAYTGITNPAILVIAGHIWTGPDGSVQLVGNSAVGEAPWLDSGTTGIQPGHLRRNLQLTLTNVVVPSGSYLPPLGGVVGGEVYTYVLGNGLWTVPSFTLGNSNKMLVTGNSVLYVPGEFSLSSNALIRLPSPDTILRVYVGGRVQFGGRGVQGIIRANQFALYGLPSCGSVTVSVGYFAGVIYAPNAACTLGAPYFVGACVAESVAFAGSVFLHFDENLSRAGRFY